MAKTNKAKVPAGGAAVPPGPSSPSVVKTSVATAQKMIDELRPTLNKRAGAKGDIFHDILDVVEHILPVIGKL